MKRRISKRTNYAAKAAALIVKRNKLKLQLAKVEEKIEIYVAKEIQRKYAVLS